MMDFIKQNKILTGGVVVVVLGLLYWAFYLSSSPSQPLLTSSAASGVSSQTQELLTTLSSLTTIRLDNSIFTDPTFVSLTSYDVTIPPQPSGRANPFAPIGGSGH